jgi:hypothetical protein
MGPPSDAANSGYIKSVIEYPSAASLPDARTLARLISSSRLVLNPSVPAGTVQLILGSTFSGLMSRPGSAAGHPSPTATPHQSASNVNLAKQGGIDGNVSICSDSSVFSGPDGQ